MGSKSCQKLNINAEIMAMILICLLKLIIHYLLGHYGLQFKTFPPSYSWYYKMFSAKKTRRIYQSPHTKVAEIDLEGLVCLSDLATVDEIRNMNKGVASDNVDTADDPFYFEIND